MRDDIPTRLQDTEISIGKINISISYLKESILRLQESQRDCYSHQKSTVVLIEKAIEQMERMRNLIRDKVDIDKADDRAEKDRLLLWKEVKDLQAFKWKLIGWAVGSGLVGAGAIEGFLEIFKK